MTFTATWNTIFATNIRFASPYRSFASSRSTASPFFFGFLNWLKTINIKESWERFSNEKSSDSQMNGLNVPRKLSFSNIKDRCCISYGFRNYSASLMAPWSWSLQNERWPFRFFPDPSKNLFESSCKRSRPTVQQFTLKIHD